MADDRNLAESFLARLDDEVRYLGIAAEFTAEASGLLAGQSRRVRTAGGAPVDDITKNVFVVHGRDEQARVALFGFLGALGLHPLG